MTGSYITFYINITESNKTNYRLKIGGKSEK